MGFFRLCNHIFPAPKNEVAPYKLNPCTTLPSSVGFASFSKNMLGFQPSAYRVISSTVLPNLKISDVSKNLLGLGFGQKPLSDLSVGTRHYSVHTNQNNIFQPIIKCLSCVTFLIGRFETVPFTNQTLYVFPFIDYIWGEIYFRSVKEGCKRGFVLPQDHPHCVRVESIATKILEELQKVTGRRHILADQQWLKGDDGGLKLVKQSRRKESDKSTSAYLKEGIEWEFFVVDTPQVNAGYINIGKILMFRGLFDCHKTGAELASIIGNEVGHVVARHAQRRLTWFPFKLYHRVIHGVYPEAYYQLRHEHEADLIGMFLCASAGYDPQAAPMALEKTDLNSEANVAFLEERIRLLSQPEVMQVAQSLYIKKQ